MYVIDAKTDIYNENNEKLPLRKEMSPAKSFEVGSVLVG